MIYRRSFLPSGSPRLSSNFCLVLPPKRRSTVRSTFADCPAVRLAYRLTRLARSGMLWRVSGKLMLSYILVARSDPAADHVRAAGVPSGLLRYQRLPRPRRVSALTEQASAFAEDDAVRDRASAGQPRTEIVIQRRGSAIATRYPGVSVDVLPAKDILPVAVSVGFAGLVLTEHRMRARGWLSADRPPGACGRRGRSAGRQHRWTRPRWLRPGITLGEQRGASLFNTATYLTYVDWRDRRVGADARLPMSVDVPTLYNWLGGQQDGEANVELQPDSCSTC